MGTWSKIENKKDLQTAQGAIKILEAIKSAKKKKKPLHLMGLLSDAGVHSHQDHLHALIKLANMAGLKKVFIHCQPLFKSQRNPFFQQPQAKASIT